jgi:hypothetical protein
MCIQYQTECCILNILSKMVCKHYNHYRVNYHYRVTVMVRFWVRVMDNAMIRIRVRVWVRVSVMDKGYG